MAEENFKVIIEIHGNIQAANVFFNFNCGADRMKIQVRDDQIFLELLMENRVVHRLRLISGEKLFIPLSYYSQSGHLFKLKKTQDMTSAKYDVSLYLHDVPSFRLQLSANKFFLEQSVKELTLDKLPNHPFQTDFPYKIICSSCNIALSNNPVAFANISNLPFDLTELYENLFCHKTSPDRNSEVISQSRNDLYITSTCYVLSCLDKSSFTTDVLLGVLRCKHCSSIISNTKRKNLDRLKDSIFCFKDKIKFNTLSTSKEFSQNTFRERTDAGLRSLISIIQETLETSVMCKLYLEAKTPVLENDCLLIWVIDPKMKRYVANQIIDEEMKFVEENIEFDSVMKILYHVTNSSTDLARSWMHDFSVDFHYISDTMLLNIPEHFIKSSCFMPRFIGYPEEFSVGYLPLDI